MRLDHNKLKVYQLALQLLDVVDELIESVPPCRANLKEQLDDAATSIVANIAEGAGEFSLKEKQRFYRMARRSVNEVGAWIEIIDRRGQAPLLLLRRADDLTFEIVSILVRLIRGQGQGSASTPQAL